MVLGVFSDKIQAEDAVDELEASGFGPDNISVVMKDGDGLRNVDSTGDSVIEGAASGVATGALAGGLVGALVGLGVPEEQAKIYEERIKSGSILVALATGSADEAEVKSILESHGADQIRSVDQDKKTRHVDAGEFDRPGHFHG